MSMFGHVIDSIVANNVAQQRVQKSKKAKGKVAKNAAALAGQTASPADEGAASNRALVASKVIGGQQGRGAKFADPNSLTGYSFINEEGDIAQHVNPPANFQKYSFVTIEQ